MSSQFDKTNYFTDCRIDFPSLTFCGKVLNDLFKQGLSINQFEEKYKRLAKSQVTLPTTEYKSSVQYNLQTDVWGPKEFIGISKLGVDYDVCAVYGIRDSGEFATVDRYLKNTSHLKVLQDSPGFRIFSVNMPYSTSSRQVLIGLTRPNEQAAMVTIMVKF